MKKSFGVWYENVYKNIRNYICEACDTIQAGSIPPLDYKLIFFPRLKRPKVPSGYDVTCELYCSIWKGGCLLLGLLQRWFSHKLGFINPEVVVKQLLK